MKLIIDIEKDYYEMLKYFVEHGDKYKPIEIIANGIPYEERTKGEWIPVSERLPNRNGCYNVTRIIEGTRLTDVCYFDGQNTWHRDTGVNHGRPYLNDVIAWQPLPKPYKEEGESDADS